MHFLKELVVETQELLDSVHETFRNIEHTARGFWRPSIQRIPVQKVPGAIKVIQGRKVQQEKMAFCTS